MTLNWLFNQNTCFTPLRHSDQLPLVAEDGIIKSWSFSCMKHLLQYKSTQNDAQQNTLTCFYLEMAMINDDKKNLTADKGCGYIK